MAYNQIFTVYSFCFQNFSMHAGDSDSDDDDMEEEEEEDEDQFEDAEGEDETFQSSR